MRDGLRQSSRADIGGFTDDSESVEKVVQMAAQPENLAKSVVEEMRKKPEDGRAMDGIDAITMMLAAGGGIPIDSGYPRNLKRDQV